MLRGRYLLMKSFVELQNGRANYVVHTVRDIRLAMYLFDLCTMYKNFSMCKSEKFV